MKQINKLPVMHTVDVVQKQASHKPTGKMSAFKAIFISPSFSSDNEALVDSKLRPRLLLYGTLQPVAASRMSSSLTPPLSNVLWLCTTKTNVTNTLEIYDHLVSRRGLTSLLPTPSAIGVTVRKHNVIHKSKPEVHNVFHCRQRRTDRPIHGAG